jgi:hypothetical protein
MAEAQGNTINRVSLTPARHNSRAIQLTGITLSLWLKKTGNGSTILSFQKINHHGHAP